MILKDFALQMCSQMSEQDRTTFCRSKWREGVRLNIAASDGRYSALDEDEVLDEMEKLIDWYQESRTYECPQCGETRNLDDATEAPCVSCGICTVCRPTAGGCGASDLCEKCQ